MKLQKKLWKNKILTDSLCNLAEWVVIIISTVILTYLAFLVWFFSFNSENSIPMKSNFFIQIIVCVLAIVVFKLLGNLLNRFPHTCKWISLGCFVLTICFVGCVSVSFVKQTLLLPVSDEKACYDIALRFYNSEFGAVVPQGSYLSLWPYQTGLIFIIEKLMRIFGTQNPLFFQYINCMYVLLIITAGYFTVCLFSKKIEGRLLYLILMVNYWPLFFRVHCIYGDLPGLTWMVVSVTCFLFWHKADKRWEKIVSMVGMAGSAILACTYKGNCLICIIGLLLVCCVVQLRRFRPIFFVAVVITAIISIFATDITQKYYEHYAGKECGDGMPFVGWIAMGLQYNGEEAMPGGWNGFHSDVFISSGYDYEATVEICEASISDSINQFIENPEFAGRFFSDKIIKQWANQTHGIWWGTNLLYDINRDENAFWVRFLNEKEYVNLLPIMDYHESVVYGILWLACITFLCKKVKREKVEMYMLLPVVNFIGGFLFSLIWEAQTSTVMSYPIMLLPIAVVAVTESEVFNRNKDRLFPMNAVYYKQ